MVDTCLHEDVAKFGDMPIAAPETLEYLGRFDVTQCLICFEILTKTPTSYPPPENVRGVEALPIPE